ncbi:type IV toxin-antitoxin system AbiEi family antitoxin [Pseudomonas sp. D(2018)]|uniref:type IV toxin-antitoxin system AbiEi family antitoxin n=1 Tax=Pseudomonas sp. D(2018) TaxID=2502238 RepID=UPI0010F9A2D5|nr:type IV toxin-antitoxin system AbiEi family antitoxin [Pseudomonas sp. D(2018)]
MKINQLITDWPPGVVATQTWLHRHGVGSSLARKYQQSGWIERIGHGAWQRRGDCVDWQGGAFALQQDLPLRVWPGGLTALALQGYSHYLPLGKEEISLFALPGTRLPGWFAEHDWGLSIRFLAANLFGDLDASAWQTSRPAHRAFPLHISSPERAAIELIYGSEDESLFSSVAELFNGLSTLSPKRVQTLLESCGSIRVKRVFLLLARQSGHAWYSHLDLTRIYLGSGKRQLIPGGALDKQFLITVPEGFADAT